MWKYTEKSKKKNDKIENLCQEFLQKLMQPPKANRNLHNSEKTSQDWSIWPDWSLLQLLTLLQEGNLFLSVALQQKVSPAWLFLLQGDLNSIINIHINYCKNITCYCRISRKFLKWWSLQSHWGMMVEHQQLQELGLGDLCLLDWPVTVFQLLRRDGHCLQPGYSRPSPLCCIDQSL